MIDRQGFRLNVGIILTNEEGKLFFGKKSGHADVWQFPQGGVNPYETLKETMYREVSEEIGLTRDDIEIIGTTRKWLHYHLPKALQRHHQKPLCIGQKQKWFLIKLISNENRICFDRTDSPEFTDWRWVDYWYPPTQIAPFKREVYRRALFELEPLFKQNILPSNEQ